MPEPNYELGDEADEDLREIVRMAEIVDCVEPIEGVRHGIEDFKAGRTMSLEAFETHLRQDLGLEPKA